MTDRVDISRLLNDMRAMKSQAQVFQRPQITAPQDVNGVRNLGAGVQVGAATKVPSFGELMTQAVSKVNEVQKTSSNMADAYERGVAGVDITDVMIASQKASVAFQATVQVRNKLIDAYRDIMNMPI
jgi:flagellar hook-basal body complex protein FliE